MSGSQSWRTVVLLKGIVHPKMKILSLITPPHVIPNLSDLHSSSEHKLSYFWWIPRALIFSLSKNFHFWVNYPFNILVDNMKHCVQESLNRNFKKNSIYLKYNFCLLMYLLTSDQLKVSFLHKSINFLLHQHIDDLKANRNGLKATKSHSNFIRCNELEPAF